MEGVSVPLNLIRINAPLKVSTAVFCCRPVALKVSVVGIDQYDFSGPKPIWIICEQGISGTGTFRKNNDGTELQYCALEQMWVIH